MKQTAVEWLYETLWKQTDFSLPNNIFEQAKVMEKEHIDKAFDNGRNEEINKGSKIKNQYFK